MLILYYFVIFVVILCAVPIWKGYTKRALKEVHFFTKVLNLCIVRSFDNGKFIV